MDDSQTTFHYYPSLALRAICAVIGVFCAFTLMALVSRFLLGGTVSLLGGIVISGPVTLAIVVCRWRISITPQGLSVRRLTRVRTTIWEDVLRLDETRKSYVIITKMGPISLAWIQSGSRERLFRQVLERAKLTFNPRKMRYGIVAEYVPRVKSLKIMPRPAAQNSSVKKESQS